MWMQIEVQRNQIECDLQHESFDITSNWIPHTMRPPEIKPNHPNFQTKQHHSICMHMHEYIHRVYLVLDTCSVTWKCLGSWNSVHHEPSRTPSILVHILFRYMVVIFLLYIELTFLISQAIYNNWFILSGDPSLMDSNACLISLKACLFIHSEYISCSIHKKKHIISINDSGFSKYLCTYICISTAFAGHMKQK